MRNYLQFDNISTDNNYINSINNSYFNAKKKFNTHNDTLKHLKNLINNEYVNYNKFNESINNDFLNKTANMDKNNLDKNNLDKNELIKQYAFIINNSDNQYHKTLYDIQQDIDTHNSHTNYFIKILKKIQYVLNTHVKNFMNINYYIRTFTNIIITNNNIKQKKKLLHKAIKKLIIHKNLINNNINNSLKNIDIILIPISNTDTDEDSSKNTTNKKIKNTNKNNISTIQKKIYNISNIIDKNKVLTSKLQNNINTIKDPKQLKFLKILHNNSIKNNKLFGGKLKQYYSELNTITNNIDKKIHVDFDINKKKEILEQIDNITPKNYKTNLKNIRKLCSDFTLNKTKYVSPNKIKHLLKKFNKIIY